MQGGGKCLEKQHSLIPLSANRYYCPEFPNSWSGGSYGQVTYPDPGRTVGRYNAEVLGGPNDTEAFISNALKQSSFDWVAERTPSKVNAYIRAGFGKTMN